MAKASAAANMICRELKIEQVLGIDMTELEEEANAGKNMDNALSDMAVNQQTVQKNPHPGISMHR